MSTRSERIVADGDAPPQGPVDVAPKRQRDRDLLRNLAVGLVGAAAAFYLAVALGEFLRPLLMALLLAYAIWPLHSWLKRFMHPGVSLVIIALGLGAISLTVGWMAFANAEQFWKEMPKYERRADQLVERGKSWIVRFLPAAAQPRRSGAPQIPLERVGEYARGVFGAFTGFVAQSALVGLYVVFMVLEASRFPRGIRRACTPKRADRILEVVDSINQAVIEYLSVKVKVNLLVAIPAALLMLGFGVEGAVLWGVLTFFARFVPYLGGIVAYALPVAAAALQFESSTRSILFAVALLVLHVVGEYVIEPVMTGKAVGLSPLVVLLALAFWDLAWGIPGMVLAVPLTVMVKIALARLEPTRPIARLLAEDD